MTHKRTELNQELTFYKRARLQCAFLAAATLALTLSLPTLTHSFTNAFTRGMSAEQSAPYRQDTQHRTPLVQILAGSACALYTAAALRFHRDARRTEKELDLL